MKKRKQKQRRTKRLTRIDHALLEQVSGAGPGDGTIGASFNPNNPPVIALPVTDE